MTFFLVRKLLRDVRLPLFVVAGGLLLFSAFWVKIAQRVTAEIAPFFAGLAQAQKLNPKLFEEVLLRGPGKVSQAVMGGAGVRFDRPTDFLAVELMHPLVLILAATWAVGRAAGAVAGELDRGTMELLLSQPIPRGRLILAHFLTDLIVIPILACSIMAGTHLGLAAVGPFKIDYTVLDKIPTPFPLPRGPAELPVDATGQPAAAAQYAALVFAFSGITILISACNRSRWRAVGLAVLAVVAMFAANVVGQLWEPAAFLRPLTLFYYYQPQQVWLNGDWAVELAGVRIYGAAVLVGVGLLGYLLAWRVFDRRDLPAPL